MMSPAVKATGAASCSQAEREQGADQLKGYRRGKAGSGVRPRRSVLEFESLIIPTSGHPFPGYGSLKMQKLKRLIGPLQAHWLAVNTLKFSLFSFS